MRAKRGSTAILLCTCLFGLIVLASACSKSPVGEDDPDPLRDTTDDPPIGDTVRPIKPAIGSSYIFESIQVQVAQQSRDSGGLTLTVEKDTDMLGRVGVSILSLQYTSPNIKLYAHWKFLTNGDLEVLDDHGWLYIPATTGSGAHSRRDTVRSGQRVQTERLQHMIGTDTIEVAGKRLACNTIHSEMFEQVLDSAGTVRSTESSTDTLSYAPAIGMIVRSGGVLSVNGKPATYSSMRLTSYYLR